METENIMRAIADAAADRDTPKEVREAAVREAVHIALAIVYGLARIAAALEAANDTVTISRAHDL